MKAGRWTGGVAQRLPDGFRVLHDILAATILSQQQDWRWTTERDRQLAANCAHCAVTSQPDSFGSMRFACRRSDPAAPSRRRDFRRWSISPPDCSMPEDRHGKHGHGGTSTKQSAKWANCPPARGHSLGVQDHGESLARRPYHGNDDSQWRKGVQRQRSDKARRLGQVCESHTCSRPKP